MTLMLSRSGRLRKNSKCIWELDFFFYDSELRIKYSTQMSEIFYDSLDEFLGSRGSGGDSDRRAIIEPVLFDIFGTVDEVGSLTE
jgi:hypothetical protein